MSTAVSRIVPLTIALTWLTVLATTCWADCVTDLQLRRAERGAARAAAPERRRAPFRIEFVRETRDDAR